MTSVLFCKHGGLIRAVTSGQEEVIVREETDTGENERMKEAYDTMNNWLLEGYSVVSEEELIQAMEYLAENGKQNSISPLREIPQGTIDKTTDEGLIMLYTRINDCIKRQEKYDNMVLAWTNYWNMRMESEFGEGNYAPVRADVVKAMLVVESNMGGEGSSMITNGQRDIKQALDCRNPVIWAVVNEYGAGRTVTIVYAEEDVESIDMENTQTVTVSSEMKDGGYGNRLFFGNGEWGVIQELFSENYDTFYAGRVMPEMSMAVGVGWYCMKLNGCGRVNEGKSLNRSEERAVFDYNGEGDSQYIWKIDNILQNMGVDILGRPYE